MEILKNHAAQILILLYLLITYGISVIEKLADWKGTISYITENYKTTFLKNYISPLITILILFEVITVGFLIFGIFSLLKDNNSDSAFLGCTFSCITILYMLIGQRIAKDFQGATSLTIYFILSVFGLFLLNS
jgi:hypothetical protein